MSFDSLAFGLFFVFILAGYHLLSGKKRTIFLLIGSYAFYASVNLAFLPLILFSTLVDYFCGIKMVKKPQSKKTYLLISIFLNLSVLFYFKYYVWAAESFNMLFDVFNIGYSLPVFKILFPIGISYYTFQTIGYSIDVYRGHVEPEKNFNYFALFVCFFPQLVAGPLERAKGLIPQIKNPKTLNYFETQKYVFYIMLGLVKKTIVSDRIYDIIQINIIDPTKFEGAAKNLSTFLLMFYRLYYDFSAYSIMAVGIAGLLGIKLSQNFHWPIYATNVAEFWRFWHITLHDWLKDYVYTPLKERKYPKIFSFYAVFILSGVWHGADMNFVLWGAVNATYLMIYIFLIKPFLKNKSWSKSKLFTLLSIVTTNFLLAMTGPFYFLDNYRTSISYILNGFRFNVFNLSSYWNSLPPQSQVELITAVSIFFILEIFSGCFYFKSKNIDDFKDNKYLMNSAIMILFLMTFFLSKESGPLFRYYYF